MADNLFYTGIYVDMVQTKMEAKTPIEKREESRKAPAKTATNIRN